MLKRTFFLFTLIFAPSLSHAMAAISPAMQEELTQRSLVLRELKELSIGNANHMIGVLGLNAHAEIGPKKIISITRFEEDNEGENKEFYCAIFSNFDLISACLISKHLVDQNSSMKQSIHCIKMPKTIVLERDDYKVFWDKTISLNKKHFSDLQAHYYTLPSGTR